MKLLELGANPNIKIDDGPSLMGLMIRSKDSRYLKKALEYKCDPNFVWPRTDHSLNSLIYSGQSEERLKLLLEYGADPNYSKHPETNPIFTALDTRSYEYIPILLENGADILSDSNSKDKFIKMLEENVQFAGTKEYKEQIKLVNYLKEKYGFEINLKYPKGRPRSEM